MNLKSVEVFDFKSIKHKTLEIGTNQLCLVGVNESGKSSFIEAISYLNITKELSFSLLNKESDRFPKGMPMVIGIFEIDRKEKEFLKFIKEYVEFDDIKGSESSSEKLYLEFKRWGNGFNNISLTISNYRSIKIDLVQKLKEENKRIEFLDTFFNKYFPVIEIYKDEDLLIEPATVESLKNTEPKYETFRRLLFIGGCKDFNDIDIQNPNSYSTYMLKIEKALNRIFKRHYKQDGSISIRIITTPNGQLNIVIQDASEQSFTIYERSPGFQYYFSFLVNKLYYNQFYGNRDIVYLLDEPGSSLHPKGAKDLLKTFDEISSRSIILYTTHNPFLAIRNSVDGLVFAQKSAKEGTKLNKKPWLKKYQIVRRELGIVLNDSFLVGEMNLIVEGITEKFVLHQIFQFDKFRHLEWLNIYDAEGVTNISQALNYLGKNNLNKNGVVLLDSDDAGNIESGKTGFRKSIDDKKWSSVRINDAFSTNGVERTFEDLFPQDLYIDAFNRYCKSLSSLGVFDSAYTDYPQKQESLSTPIINHLSTHFFSFIKDERAKSNSVSKQDVMRHVFDLLQKSSEEEQNKALDKVFNLAKLIDEKIKTIEKHVNN